LKAAACNCYEFALVTQSDRAVNARVLAHAARVACRKVREVEIPLLSLHAVLKGERLVLASRKGVCGDRKSGCERGNDEGGEVNHD